MAASTFFIPSANVIDAGSLKETMNTMVIYGVRHTFIATDDKSKKSGITGNIQKSHSEMRYFRVIYDGDAEIVETYRSVMSLTGGWRGL